MAGGGFIVLDGIDGCGKSTQAKRLARRIEARGREVLHTREPGGTRVGERVRALLLDKALGDIHPGTEVFLYQAARAQLVAEVVRPALERGLIVVCERWHYATFAYQTAAHGADSEGAPEAMVIETSAWATQGTEPDRAVLLDIPVDDTSGRMNRELDRIEARGDAYRAAVASVYRRVFASDHPRFRVVDASGSRDDVEARVWEAVHDVVAD